MPESTQPCSTSRLYLRRHAHIEQQARDNKLDCEARRQLRQELAVPVLAELKKWKDERIGKTTPTSKLGKALGYLHNQWAALQVYVGDGEVPIDNNFVENKIRPIALGRRNYLFCGSDDGAERAATLYTVLATCKLAGVEPWAYLNDVLPRLAKLGEGDDVASLLPAAWKAARVARSALEPGDVADQAA